MLERIFEWWNGLNQQNKRFAIGAIFGAIFFVFFVIGVVGVLGGNRTSNSQNGTESEFVLETESETETVTESQTESESEIESEVESESEVKNESTKKEDPQSDLGGGMTSQNGASVNISQVVSQAPSNETKQTTIGIDISEYQKSIDWKKVSEAGVDFAIIRVGYREMKTGKIVEDLNAKYNIQQANKYGIKVGVYFASAAISKEEAIEEANWVINLIKGYQITYPVVFDFERFEKSENRHAVLDKTQRTDVAIAFMDTIKNKGYTPMFYASKSGMENNASWEMNRLSNNTYKIWVAQYPNTPYPQTVASSYSGEHAMWQYTNKGTVPGISGTVDMNVAYFGYEKVEGPQDTPSSEEVEVNVEAGMNFKNVERVDVTAQIETWLRSSPDKNSETNKVHMLKNGEIAVMTGISGNEEWARVEYNNQILYAYKKNLTTDTTVKEPTYEELHGIKTQFKEVDDWVTKVDRVEQVNLREKPTTDDNIAPKKEFIYEGDVLHRIGISVDAAGTYSKVEYVGADGSVQILYCSSQYLKVVEKPTEESESQKAE